MKRVTALDTITTRAGSNPTASIAVCLGPLKKNRRQSFRLDPDEKDEKKG